MNLKQNSGRDEEDHTTKVVGIHKNYMRDVEEPEIYSQNKGAIKNFLIFIAFLILIFIILFLIHNFK
jgi:hypothetical protein